MIDAARRLRRRRTLCAAAVVAVIVGLLSPSVAVADESAPVIAYDSMNRSTAKGWGVGDSGVSYSATPANVGTTSAGWATLASPRAGTAATMTLDGRSATDQTIRVDVLLPELPPAGSTTSLSAHGRVTNPAPML